MAPLIIAHRGHCADLPEQTMAAYRRAVELGADMIEADVHRTRDGRFVMLHDATLDRTTNGSGPVASCTFDELRRLDAGAGERVPSLDELYALAIEAGIALCLEVKDGTPAEAVAREIAQRDRLDVDVLASFDHPTLAAAARAVPGLRIAPDRLPERGPANGDVLVEQARAIAAPIIQHHHADLDRETVEAVHAAGVQIWAWPPLTDDEIERTVALGVDGVMGDDVGAIYRLIST